MRLFVGIPLSPIVVDELTKLTARLRTKEDSLRWAPPETWHVTLQFLGSTDQQQYNCLVPRLREIRFPPIPIRLESTGVFDRAGIFFADVKPAPPFWFSNNPSSPPPHHAASFPNHAPTIRTSPSPAPKKKTQPRSSAI